MTIAEKRMATVFNEWMKRYIADPESVKNVIDGASTMDYGEFATRCFYQISDEMRDVLPRDHVRIASFTCSCTMHGDQWLTPHSHRVIAELRENNVEFVTLKCHDCGKMHKVVIDPDIKGPIMEIMNCEEKDEK